MKKQGNAKRTLRGVLAAVLTLAMLLTLGIPFAMAADNDPITVIWAAESINKTFTAADRAELFTDVGPFSYVEINTFGTFRYTPTPAIGIKVEDILQAANVDTANLEPDRIITFRAGDGFNASLTWAQLTETRYTYTYPSGTMSEDQLKLGVINGEPVPAIIGFNQGSSGPRNFMGLTYPSEQFRGMQVQTIASIEIGGLADTWGAPYVFVENGEAASGTPLASGSTITAGTKLRINCDAHGQSGTSHKYFYTTDGTDPVPGNANTFAFNWNSNSPSVFSNPSIVVPEGSGQFVIKTMTYGYGRLQSNVMTYAYNYPVPDNAAFLTGPSEVNIDVEDGIEYVVNVAKVENINMFDIALSYDASKLTFDEIELSLPSALAAWVIPESIKNSASAGTLEFTIAGGARNEVLTSVDATSIASVKFTLKDSVKAGDELSASLTAATLYNPVNGSKHDATITGGAVLTLLTENGFDPLMYDINNDGVFDLVDLSIIIFRYFQVAQGEALWAEAALYDIMPNGVIDTADIIALYSIIISL